MEGVASKLKRRGWCGCLQNDEPPEITYCVVDGAGTLSLQAVPPALAQGLSSLGQSPRELRNIMWPTSGLRPVGAGSP